MSGHSKWHQIKHKKAVTDQKKGKLFGRLAREILMAARDQPDPARNAALREVIARARAANLPQANIDRLLQRTSEAELSEVVYEGFGPAATTWVVVTLTDNPNRTVAELKTLFKKHGGTLGVPGSTRWQFALDIRFIVTAPAVTAHEATELALIEAGAADITIAGDQWIIHTTPAEQSTVREAVTNHHLTLHEAVSTYTVLAEYQQRLATADQELVERLMADLEDYADVVQVAANVVDIS